jgi:hypothetical protein
VHRAFHVDLAVLGQVHLGMRRLRHSLDELSPALARGGAETLGHERVAGALRDYVACWGAGRDQVAGELDDAARRIAHAVDEYQTADSAIRSASER